MSRPWTYLPSILSGPLAVDRAFYDRLARETGLQDDRHFMKASPARTGDFFEFLAEIDLLCAISTCPGGDLSIPLWGPDARDPIEVCRPLGVDVWQPEARLPAGWQSPEPAAYRGNHGMPLPVPSVPTV